MRAIRARIARSAELVQTEDAGSTARDTGCSPTGGVREPSALAEPRSAHAAGWTREHPLWRYLAEHGAADEALALVRDEHAVPPDVIGLNYYVTSDRYLDDRLDRYPARSHGGNGAAALCRRRGGARAAASACAVIADVLARGLAAIRLPVAITEAHSGARVRSRCAGWSKPGRARAGGATRGADVRAVTAWALLGIVGLGFAGDADARRHYEPGAFDVHRGRRRVRPRSRAVVADLAAGRRPRRIRCLSAPGLVAASRRRPLTWRHARPHPRSPAARGTLGRCVRPARASCAGCALRAPVAAGARHRGSRSGARRVDRWQPWAVVNAAGYVRVDEAEQRRARVPPRQHRRAGDAGGAPAARRGIQLVTFSSDLVFDGAARPPYRRERCWSRR